MGWPTVFIRLTGCPLRCHYCDTTYAFKGGQIMTINQILAEVASYKSKFITVTGGEPLAQTACLSLLTQLANLDYQISIETSGALDISRIDPRVIRILDIKTPHSGEIERNYWENLNYLSPKDQVKFVIGNFEDYVWSKKIVQQHTLYESCTVLFSPSYGLVSNQELADWIVQDRLPVRFQLQMHKYIWGDIPGK